MFPGFADKLVEMNDAGFSGIELRTDNIITSGSMKYAEQLQRRLKSHDLKIFSVHAPFMGVDVSADDEYIRTKAVRDIEKAVLIASKLDAEFVVMHISVHIKDRKNRMENALRSLRTIRETCETFNVKPVVENTLPAMLNSTIEEMKMLADEGCLLCLDTGHSLIAGISNKEAYAELGNAVKIVHLHCNNSREDQHRFDCLSENEDIITLLKQVRNSIIVFEVNEKAELSAMKEFINDCN